MSDCNNKQDLDSALDHESSKLHTCLFSAKPLFIQSVKQLLNSDRYKLICFDLTQKLLSFVTQNKEQIDCLVLVNNSQLRSALDKLRQARILLPTIIIENQLIEEFTDANQKDSELLIDVVDIFYHPAEVRLYVTQLKEINSYISLAISKFLNLVPESEVPGSENDNCQNKNKLDSAEAVKNSLTVKQRRLIDKIKERLGYLGVYYKRNVDNFYRNLSTEEQANLDSLLTNNYRQILLEYFEDNLSINKLIDEFVDLAFFADLSTSKILEIHMSLMDSFSHQLQIEGRNDDILLDYRLPLIDVLSHFCEIYRRSIPEKDVSLELLFGVK